ncbi:MAG TPA: hypothetical protein VLK23_07090 [Thermodesulfobacteriota bacterium]|nr:hypothetical protein [Thermodesulfobacteriota bacterium]
MIGLMLTGCAGYYSGYGYYDYPYYDNGYRYYGGYGLYDYPHYDYGYRYYGYPYRHGHEWREHHRH